MRLLCHDAGCDGHDRSAGNDPNGSCRFCHRPLADGHGVLLIESPATAKATPTDLVAVGICSAHGHVWEGSMHRRSEEWRGGCSRCGLGIVLPFGH